MAVYRLAVIIANPSNEDEFLLVKQIRPPKFGIEEYDSYIDSDLLDLPSIQLDSWQGESEIQVEGAELCADKLDLRKFDLRSALSQVSEQVGIERLVEERWRFWKYAEEADFGPGNPIHTVFITGQNAVVDGSNNVACQWMTRSECVKCLVEVKKDSNRIGPLVVTGILHEIGQSSKWGVPPYLPYQEYPSGVVLIPMSSRTSKPFRTTNLIVVAPETVAESQSDKGVVAHGDALIVDPGCSSRFHQELKDIVASLPRKLIVFVTHHHHDHVDGLSVIQKCNPDAILLAHENTMRRIGKDDWSLGYTSVMGSEEICVGEQEFRVIFAPGHTDGHMALLHINTHALIVGDHCVGQGSALLDSTAGGNMADYFQTTYKFLELSANVLIPMHGRVNLWPKHMLCGYLKNRRDRESSILKAIEEGRTTLFDIVATVYMNVDRGLWFAAASNVKLHVEHLAQQNRLPKGFSLETYKRSVATFADGMRD
uniref:Metallo-beta-lactamase domain-containing protein n=1 Tax=Opuntia streptacantha TaxID=393608 RepID=A0A7C8ZR95_OPUST